MEQFVDALKIILPTTALFISIIVCLAVQPNKIKKVIAKMALVIAVSALLLYGYGYANQTATEMPGPVAVIRATMDVLRVFVGGNNWDMVKSAYPRAWQQIAFWLLHLAALFTSASAVITSLGSRLIRRIRMGMLRMWDLSLICGLNEKTLDFGRELLDSGVRSVLYVDRNPEQSLTAAVEHMGCVVRSDRDALDAIPRFLRSIGVKAGKWKLHVYALDSDTAFNQQYAGRLVRSLEARGVDPDNSTLTILYPDEEITGRFLRSESQYGYGSVLTVSEPDLTARMLIKAYPPCDVISFDAQGQAQNDLHAVVVGFGHIGQAVLKQLVINGQFSGNQSHMAVFAPNYPQRMGLLAHECGEMLKRYDISFYANDGRSCEMFDYLATHADTVNYIVVCAGNHSVNLEIAEQLRIFLKRRNNSTPIYMCSSGGVFYQDADNHLHAHKFYTMQNLCTDQIDRMAMVLHHHYSDGGSIQQNWRECDYFNRMSSRSAADFWYAILRAAGTTLKQAKENWAPQGQLLENLAKMEHLRWNAFHYSMGFRPMPEQAYQERVAAFQKAKEADPDTNYRIAKDMERRLHACLIPWEELDEYSRKENAVTGENRNYSENDRKNIRVMGEVLREMDAS